MGARGRRGARGRPRGAGRASRKGPVDLRGHDRLLRRPSMLREIFRFQLVAQAPDEARRPGDPADGDQGRGRRGVLQSLSERGDAERLRHSPRSSSSHRGRAGRGRRGRLRREDRGPRGASACRAPSGRARATCRGHPSARQASAERRSVSTQGCGAQLESPPGIGSRDVARHCCARWAARRRSSRRSRADRRRERRRRGTSAGRGRAHCVLAVGRRARRGASPWGGSRREAKPRARHRGG